SRQFEVIWHFHGDSNDVHCRAVHEVVVVVERVRHTKEFAGSVGRFALGGGQRRDLEVIRERLQSRNVRLRRPSPIRIGADDADTYPLRSTFDYSHVLLPHRNFFSAPPHVTTSSSTVPTDLS